MSLSQQETGLDIGGELFFVESETSDQSNAILNCSAVATGHFSLYVHCSVYFYISSWQLIFMTDEKETLRKGPKSAICFFGN